ncbi:MAG: polysaccharide deacetylase family protein [Chitinophagaceae bacterium]|nr:polysaccharide deacetylase family protein [Chitinophagaceae bacterium]
MSLRLLFKKKRTVKKGLVLMYHRIADTGFDPWSLCVSPSRFENQVKLLKNKYNVIGYQQLGEYFEGNSVKEDFILVTFDDGYLDNYETAAPILTKYNCPAIFFITSGAIDRSRLFWWDVLEGIFLNRRTLPSTLNIQAGSINFSCNTETIAREEKLRLYNAYGAWLSFLKQLTDRQALFLKTWEYMRYLQPELQQQMLGLLQEWSKLKKEEIPLPGIMNMQQLKQLSENTLFEIGGHTLSHPALAHFDKSIQEKETGTSIMQLEQWLGKKITCYSYPFGSYNNETLQIIKGLGIKYAFTTKPESINKQLSPTELPRFLVKNLDTDAFDKALKIWYAFD